MMVLEKATIYNIEELDVALKHMHDKECEAIYRTKLDKIVCYSNNIVGVIPLDEDLKFPIANKETQTLSQYKDYIIKWLLWRN